MQNVRRPSEVDGANVTRHREVYNAERAEAERGSHGVEAHEAV